MKNVILLFLIIIVFSALRVDGQKLNPLVLQGIKQGEFTFLKGEGYSIFFFDSKRTYSPKSVKKIKRKFKVSKKLVGSSNKNVLSRNVEFKRTVSENDKAVFTRSLIYQKQNGGLRFVELVTSIQRDTFFENEIISLVNENTIPKEIFNRWKVDSVRFVHRHLKLGSQCQWQNVGSLQCPYKGQMDWSIFTNEERARIYMNQRINVADDPKMAKIVTSDSLSVIFEEAEVIARKSIMKLKVPKSMLGGSNELTIYYVLTEIEGVFVAAVLSHYSNDQNAPNLPPLLSEVMSLKSGK